MQHSLLARAYEEQSHIRGGGDTPINKFRIEAVALAKRLRFGNGHNFDLVYRELDFHSVDLAIVAGLGTAARP
jgi:hypothetical protein